MKFYKVGKCRALRINCCSVPNKLKHKTIDGKYPRITHAPDPQNVIWHNIPYTTCNRFWRKSFVALISIIIMIASFVAIVLCKD